MEGKGGHMKGHEKEMQGGKNKDRKGILERNYSNRSEGTEEKGNVTKEKHRKGCKREGDKGGLLERG